MSQKWKEAQEAHDTYMMKITDPTEIENEEKWIEELEARYEVIERETVVALKKFGPSATHVPLAPLVPLATPPKVNTTSANDSLALAKEVEKTQIQFERVKMDKFCGDIRKYPGWKERTEFYIENRCPKSEQAFILRSLLEPVVKEEVENVEDNVCLLWQRLDEKYGNVRKYVDLVLSELSKVSKGDGSATLLMIKTVEKSYRDLERIGAELEMSNAYIIALIEKKLPEEMRLDWVKLIAEKGEVDSRKTFFLARWRRVIEYDAAAIRKAPEKRVVGRVNHAANGKPKIEAKAERCWIHEDGSHPVWNCKIFQMLSIKEKLDMVKERKACRASLDTTCQGAQDAKECQRNFKCLMKECGEPHNILIHQ